MIMRRISMLMLGLALFGFGTTRLARGDEMPGRATAMAEDQIQTRFQSDADLRNNHIQATIDNGVATLKGTVDTDAEKSKAARLAMVKGVTGVDNQLKVGSATTKAAMADSTITARLKTEMLAEEPLRSVHIETNNAVVSLSGTVPTSAARDRALDLARSMSGVSRVEDSLKILPPR
jgi:osmotically-inducible protein OsmY